jgi:hypothetical protein
MRPLSRIGDISVSVCCCHSGCVGTVGVLIPMQTHTKTENRSNVRCLDISIHSCGHISIVATCSNFTNTVNRGQARIGDIVIGCPIGTITTGSIFAKAK